LKIPDVSVKIDLVSMVGAKMNGKNEVETVNFDVKVKLEEKERTSQTIVVGFALLLTTKPAIVRFEVGGTATMTGKDGDVRKMLDVDPETRVPPILQRIYQHAFTAMYLMSTMLSVPPPPRDLLYSGKQAGPVEGVSVEVGPGTIDVKDAVSIQADTGDKDAGEVASQDTRGSQ
jgi:hypothetical protein